MSSTEGAAGAGPARVRTFGAGLAVILCALAAWQLWRGHRAAAVVLAGAGVHALAFALLAPGALRPVQRAFLGAGRALGWVNTRIILAAMFYLVFTPIALVMRLLGRDPLARSREPGLPSYWVRRGGDKRGPERYEKMW